MKASGSDTVFYPYRTLRTYDRTSEIAYDTIAGSSWLGGHVIKKSDGTFLFENMWDTVIIKSQANTGDSWIFFNDSFYIYYTATVTSEDTMTVLGILDSVKTITITADSTGGVPYTIDPVNNFQIVLSKNNGFVQVFDLYTFPYHRPDSVSFNLPHWYWIRGFDHYLDVLLGNLGSCDLGCFYDNRPSLDNSIFHLFPFHNPTQNEIYDFHIGDVYETSYWGGSVGEPIATNTYTLDSFLMPSGVSHTMTVNIDQTHIPYLYDTTYSTAYFSDTGSISGSDSIYLVSTTSMPEEASGDFILHYFPHLRVLPTSCDSPASYVFISGINFWYNGVAEIPSIDSDTYSIGYGQTGKSIDIPIGEQFTEGYVYYHKDSSTCGSIVLATPRDRTAVATPTQNNGIQISPNPATDHIDITFSNPSVGNAFISVYDITGKCVFRTQTLLQAGLIINTASWIDGLYMMIVENNEGIEVKQKVIVRK